jgi:hypothetical protein
MANEEALKAALEHYRGQERKLLDDLQSVRFTIRHIERDLGIQSQDSTNNHGTVVLPTGNGVSVPSATAGRPNVRPDEFFGMTHADAARQYLKKVGHAISFEDLVEALQRGGCRVGGVDPKRTLYVSLVRNARGFIPPQSGYIGLREFYPNIVREAKEKGKRKRGRPRKVVVARGRPPAKPSQLGVLVREVMSDKQLRSLKDIAQAVGARLGRSIEPIGVRGVLNNKSDFEKVDGKYRLVK